MCSCRYCCTTRDCAHGSAGHLQRLGPMGPIYPVLVFGTDDSIERKHFTNCYLSLTGDWDTIAKRWL
jgi:hypothetical protein